jgi:HrpA-like RNA helicase
MNSINHTDLPFEDSETPMRSLKELGNKAAETLILPYPSIKLPDWTIFNELTGGLRSREYTILCGPTGSGKTTWLANLSMQMLLKRVPHFVASVETGPIDFICRVMSAFARFDMNTGDPVPLEKVKKVRTDYANIFESSDLMLSLYENRISVHQLLRDLIRAHDEYGCKVAMLDNLNFFLEITSAQNERIEMDKTTHELIMFCKQVDMHIIMVMHPKKTDHGRVESEFDIKGSSSAVQEAHNVFLFNRPTEDQQEAGYTEQHFRELKFAKLRRRGKYVGQRILYRNLDSYYHEEKLACRM